MSDVAVTVLGGSALLFAFTLTFAGLWRWL
jgi:hypothetical protein